MRKKPLVLGCLGIGTLIIFIMAIGAGTFFYNRYQTEVSSRANIALPLQVSINSPQPGSHGLIGQPITVGVTGIGPEPFISMELWVDGVLAGILEAPNGRTPFGTRFEWIPGGTRRALSHSSCYRCRDANSQLHQRRSLHQCGRSGRGGQCG